MVTINIEVCELENTGKLMLYRTSLPVPDHCKEKMAVIAFKHRKFQVFSTIDDLMTWKHVEAYRQALKENWANRGFSRAMVIDPDEYFHKAVQMNGDVGF